MDPQKPELNIKTPTVQEHQKLHQCLHLVNKRYQHLALESTKKINKTDHILECLQCKWTSKRGSEMRFEKSLGLQQNAKRDNEVDL